MLKINLDKAAYLPGETVNVSVELGLKKPVKARALVLEFACYERVKRVERHVMDQYNYDREHELGIPVSRHIDSHVIEEGERKFYQKKEFSGGEFSNAVFEAAFVIPEGAPPTSLEFGHDSKTFVWKVFAKLDVPLAVDKNAEADVFVEGL